MRYEKHGVRLKWGPLHDLAGYIKLKTGNAPDPVHDDLLLQARQLLRLVHGANGALLSSYKFAGYVRALRDRQMRLSGDGLILVALTGDPRLVFVPVGP